MLGEIRLHNFHMANVAALWAWSQSIHKGQPGNRLQSLRIPNRHHPKHSVITENRGIFLGCDKIGRYVYIDLQISIK